MFYYPGGIANDDMGRVFYQTTYDSVHTKEEAEDMFSFWEDNYGYSFLATWIEDSNGGIHDLHVYVDSLGTLIRKDGKHN